MRFFLSLLLCLVLPTSAVFANDSQTFNIKVFGSVDTEAPTIPVLSPPTPISTDQIDVSWTASTDNFAVAGYVVSRNGSPVATTTLTSYSDTGLSASTTYSYSVRAFDLAFNYSSSSATASATTLKVPPPPPPSSSNSAQSTATRVILNQLKITSGVSTSTFFIKTALPARFEMRWGRTGSYELGYIANTKYTMQYETTLTGLEPATTYEYEVIGYTPFGKASVLERGKFTTLGEQSKQLPPNVNRFKAIANEADVDLLWQLPEMTDMQYVRIVRNHLGFPTHMQDGAIVYQGKGSDFTDKGILNQYSPVYYTAFVVDAAGNVSSGAIAKAFVIDGNGNPEIIGAPTPGITGGGEKSEDGYTPGAGIPPQTRMPDMSEIFLNQADFQYTFAHQKIELDSMAFFTLSIPKSAVSDNLKTIIVTLTDPTDARQSSSFLLRINKDKTAYEAVIAPLGLEGASRILVDIYDYDAKVLGTYQKTVTFKNLYYTKPMPVFPDLIIFELKRLLPFLVSLLILIFLFIFYRRRRRHDS
jgi:chitodextrinase